MSEEHKPAADTPKADDSTSGTVTPPAAVEAKPEETKPTETKTEAKEPEAKPIVPEKYDLKLPEGSALKAEHIEKVASYAKEKGLTQEQAQELLVREDAAVAAFAESQKSQHQAAVEKWATEVQADKEIGGDACKENVELAKRVIDRFGSEALKKSLDETGFGNYPELVRVFVRIGKQMGEDKLIVPQASGTEGKKSHAEILYPSMKD